MVFCRLSKAAVQVDNREPEQISMRQMTSEVSSGHYMPLVKASQSSGSPEVIPSVDASSLSHYEPLNPSSISHEILRQNVIIERIIGKGVRGLNDTYFKDPDIKPQTSLTSQNLMKFSWQVADGMSYLSSRSVSWNILLLCIQISLVQTAYIVQTKIMQLRTHSIPLTLISATFCFNLRFDIRTTQW